MANFDDLFPDTGPQPKAGDLCEATCGTCEQPFTYELTGYTDNGGTFHGSKRWHCDPCEKARSEERDREKVLRFREDRYSGYRERFDYYTDFGSRLAKASIADFQVNAHNRGAFTAARGWLEQPMPTLTHPILYGQTVDPIRTNLIIVGPIGSGKSYLAACLYRALCVNLEPVLWVNAGSLIAEVRRGFSDKDSATRAASKIAAAASAPTLVIDDLGKVHPGKDVSWIEEQFYALVDERYRNERPTIVTTEWQSTALAARVGESVVSRLIDGAAVASIKAPKEPYRRLQEGKS